MSVLDLDYISKDNSNNYEFMIKKLNRNYNYYDYSSDLLKNNYMFCIDTINSCISQLNKKPQKSNNIKEFNTLIQKINKNIKENLKKEFKSGIDKNGNLLYTVDELTTIYKEKRILKNN